MKVFLVASLAAVVGCFMLLLSLPLLPAACICELPSNESLACLRLSRDSHIGLVIQIFGHIVDMRKLPSDSINPPYITNVCKIMIPIDPDTVPVLTDDFVQF
jgi:hypothetical protein